MTVINRFSITDRVALSFTGNTLGLIGTFNPSQSTISGAADGIGTFITNNTGLQSPGGYPAGTTQTFSLNSSSAVLSILSGSTILYAELVWSGIQSNGLQNVSGSVNNAVQLTTPLGSTFNISPNPSTSQFISNIFSLVSPYGRTANVTSIVQAAGAGTYTVSNVPCALGGGSNSNPGDLESNYLGWTLAVVYKNSILNYRNLNLWVLFEGVKQNATVDVPISGFATSSTGALSSRIAVSAGSGDSYLSGDSLFFGPNTSSLTVMSGPNNATTNFFSSQLNHGDSQSANVGQLNTSGTFGNNNQPIGSKSLNGRQGWDVTNINSSSAMINNQTSAVIRFITSGDVYVPVVLGLQIDVNSANLTPITKIVDKAFALLNDTLTYTVSFKNAGLVSANNSIFIDTIPTSTTFIPNSLTVNGVPQSSSPNPPGVSLGTIGPSASVTVSFKVRITTIPASKIITNQGGVGYNFISAPTLSPISAFDSSNTVTTTIVNPSMTNSKQVNKVLATIGDILTYTIPLKNTGDITLINIVLKDTLPSGVTYVSGSFKQDGTPLSGSPSTVGNTLPNSINPSATSTITFQVIVNTLPTPNPIFNSASAIYSYTIDNSSTPVRTGSSSANTNIVSTKINVASLGGASKYTNKSFADCGETILYTILIPNSGNVTALNVVFKDTIPNGTTFVTDSVFINNTRVVGANPSLGVTIPDIAPGSSASLTFEVKVNC